MIVHTRGDPLQMIPKVRAIASQVDPTVRLSKLQRVEDVLTGILWILNLWLRSTLLLSAIALMLSLAGIYSVMSFTVSRRTREIGIRVALGANARQVVASIFRRPLWQVVSGVATGAVLAGLGLVALTSCQDGVCDKGNPLSIRGAVLLVTYAMFILGVCLLACVVPTRRALAVEPVDALRTE
jgi:ABC-type antimicrobial peptide transport system permease subunit